MADYYAVLNRTLSGFGNANAQLRTKLYDRARLTIRGQLEGRKPALDDAAVAAEMEKLEQAISKIEKENGDEVPVAAKVPVEETPSEVSPPPAAEPTPEAKTDSPEPSKSEETPKVESEPDAKPEPAEASADEPKAEPTEANAPAPASDDATSGDAGETKSNDEDAPAASETSSDKPDEPADPILDAISEFTESDATRKSEKPVVLEEVQDPTDIVEAKLLKDVSSAVNAAAEEAPVALEPEQDDQTAVELEPAYDDETLKIPPATDGLHKKSKAQLVSRWISVILLVLAIGAALWAYQKPIMIAVGLAEDPTKPKPVKTISIKPEPENETAEVKEEPKPEAEPKVEEPVVPEPKLEERLTESGEEIQPVAPTEPLVPQQTGDETVEAAPTDSQTGEEVGSQLQTAILYEKNPLPPSKGLDAGTARWSVVQEAPATGQPEEPAIRGEIEIPSRNTVMIMTIKRNADPALTASHLIELIFAVPDNFSGGTIDTINRIVLKENEQDRGAPLEAVPVKISDGIFLIALDNLPAAQQKNEYLLKTRTWVDIPLQYRTGAQALITLEKGVAGQKIFDEVFKAWDAAAKQP